MLQNKSTPVAAVADAVSVREVGRAGARAPRCARAADAPPQTRLTTPPQFLHRGKTNNAFLYLPNNDTKE